ncbi:MAG: TolC family protein [Bacteroidetes bacterium]|nr:TolC family protein [Bacteroidota bacterium]MCW5896700.1 TolC family protein [Bacteroidota bacterium]
MTYAQGFNVLAGCCRSKAGRWVAIVLVFVLPDQCAVGQTVPDFQDELGADPEQLIVDRHSYPQIKATTFHSPEIVGQQGYLSPDERRDSRRDLKFRSLQPGITIESRNFPSSSVGVLPGKALRFRDTFSGIYQEFCRTGSRSAGLSSISFVKKWTTGNTSVQQSSRTESGNVQLDAKPITDSLSRVEQGKDIVFSVSRTDSLTLQLLDIEIAQAELEAAATDFWHRLIPDIRVSANFGVQQLAFVDPTTFTPYKLPKDSYRLTLSLSLSDIWNSKQHEQALLVLDRLRIKKRELEQKLDTDKHRLLRHRAALQKELDFRLEELSLLQQSLKYTQLLFEEGKADFNALVRAKRQVLNVEKSISMTRTRQAGAETE